MEHEESGHSLDIGEMIFDLYNRVKGDVDQEIKVAQLIMMDQLAAAIFGLIETDEPEDEYMYRSPN